MEAHAYVLLTSLSSWWAGQRVGHEHISPTSYTEAGVTFWWTELEAPKGTQPVHVGGCAGCDSGQPDVRSSPQARQVQPGEVSGCQGISCPEKTKISVSTPGHRNW